MKQRLHISLLIALAAATLCSCVSHIVQPETEYIEFSTVVKNSSSTKASAYSIVQDSNYPADQPFVVSAHYSGDLFATTTLWMNKVVINYAFDDENGNTLWRNDSNHYYWPFGGSMLFRAYTPTLTANYAKQVDITLDKGVVIDDYTIDHNHTAGDNRQLDLMYAYHRYNDINTRTAAVPMAFRHALCQIAIKAKLDRDYSAENIVVKVKEVTISNVANTGDFTQNPASWTSAIYTNSLLFDVVDDNSTLNYYTAEQITNNQVPEITERQLVIPQHMPANDDELAESGRVEVPTITVVLEVTQKNSNGQDYTLQSTLSKSLMLGTGQTNNWNINTKLTYTLNIGLNAITFSAVEVEWDQGSAGDIVT